MLTHAREMLDAADRARDAVAEVSGGLRGELRVGIMHALVVPPIVKALNQFRHQRPAVQMRPHTRPDGSTGLVRAVAGNELDIAFAAASAPAPGVAVTVLRREDMVLICQPRHRLARRRRVSVHDLLQETFVDVPPGWGSRISADKLFADHGAERTVDIEIGDVPTVVDLVRAGLGIALIAPSSAPTLEGVVTIAVRPAPVFDLNVAVPSARPVKPAAQFLAGLVLNACAQLASSAATEDGEL